MAALACERRLRLRYSLRAVSSASPDSTLQVKVAMEGFARLGWRALEEVELVNAAVLVAALFCRQIEAPGPAIGQHDEGNAGMEGVFERLADGIFGFAGLFDLDKDGGFGWWMAEGEISATLAGLVFRPHDGGVPRVPAEFLKHAKDNALGNRLLVREFTVAKAGCDVGESGFE